MTELQRRALASLVLPADAVDRMYNRCTQGHGHPDDTVRALCESHERLRAELTGLQVLYDEAQREVERLQELARPSAVAVRLAMEMNDIDSFALTEIVNRLEREGNPNE